MPIPICPECGSRTRTKDITKIKNGAKLSPRDKRTRCCLGYEHNCRLRLNVEGHGKTRKASQADFVQKSEEYMNKLAFRKEHFPPSIKLCKHGIYEKYIRADQVFLTKELEEL